MRQWIRLLLVIVGVVVAIGVARWTFAEAAQQQPTAPMVISGNDVGFRVDRQHTQQLGKLSGAWVVRVNGQWVEPETSTTRNLSTR